MAHIKPILIDCNLTPDLLAHWPVGDIVRASDTAISLAIDLGGWTLIGTDLDARAYEIDPEDRIILINNGGMAHAAIARSRYFQNILTLRTFAALRAAWQTERENDALSMHRLDLWPLLRRILSADIAAMTVRMAYELREDGNDSLWHHALGEEAGDIALDYARTLSRAPDDQNDAPALASAFLQWFDRDARQIKCDFETLQDMDGAMSILTMDGRGTLSEGAIRCLTVDPMTCASYLGATAAEIAGNPAWRGIPDPIAEAHFAQIIEEIGATRIGHVAMRDRKLAARLFPDALLTV